MSRRCRARVWTGSSWRRGPAPGTCPTPWRNSPLAFCGETDRSRPGLDGRDGVVVDGGAERVRPVTAEPGPNDPVNHIEPEGDAESCAGTQRPRRHVRGP